MILAPEHPLNEQLLDAEGKARAKAMVDARANRDPGDIEKEGFFSGHYALNPFSGEKAPIWIANFVLMGYGTGAIMAVPAHDERDFEFCRKYGIAVRPVIRPVAGPLAVEPGLKEAFSEYGVVENSGQWSGLASEEARRQMAAYAKAHGFGEPAITLSLIHIFSVFRLRFPDYGSASHQRAAVGFHHRVDFGRGTFAGGPRLSGKAAGFRGDGRADCDRRAGDYDAAGSDWTDWDGRSAYRVLRGGICGPYRHSGPLQRENGLPTAGSQPDRHFRDLGLGAGFVGGDAAHRMASGGCLGDTDNGTCLLYTSRCV